MSLALQSKNGVDATIPPSPTKATSRGAWQADEPRSRLRQTTAPEPLACATNKGRPRGRPSIVSTVSTLRRCRRVSSVNRRSRDALASRDPLFVGLHLETEL